MNSFNWMNQRPLHLASAEGYSSSVQLLLDAGAWLRVFDCRVRHRMQTYR